MKKLYIVMIALVLGTVQSFAQATHCDHLKCKVEEKLGKIQFVCQDCNKVADLNDWVQKEDLGYSLIDPYLDVNADACDIGQQKVYMTGSANILKAFVMEKSTGELLAFVNNKDNAQPMAELTLPWKAVACRAKIIAEVQRRKMVETTKDDVTTSEQKIDTVFCAMDLDYKPFHSIRTFSVLEMANSGKDGMANPYNLIRFSVLNPDEKDVMEDDKFVVFRAKKPDFSDMEPVGYFGINEYSSKQTLADGQTVGWYEVKDSDEYAQYNSDYVNVSAMRDGVSAMISNDSINDLDKVILKGFYTHPNQPMYYRIERAVVASLWEQHRGRFILDDSVNVSSQLPSVTSIKVVKDANWDTNKKVKINIELANPYPWEYNELTDSITVHAYMKKEWPDLCSRRYRWSEDAVINVTRYTPNESEWTSGIDDSKKTYTIKGSDVTWNADKGVWEASVEDVQGLPFVHLYYNAEVAAEKSLYPISGNNDIAKTTETEANECYSTIGKLLGNVKATQNKMPGKVLVEWDLGVKTVSKVVLERRKYTADYSQEWVTITENLKDQPEYLDKDVMEGQAYEYRLHAEYVYRNLTISDYETVLGWPSYRTTIKGSVKMPNGTGVAGVKVSLKRVNPIFIEDVRDSLGNIVMYGSNDGITADARPRYAEQDVTAKDSVYAFTMETVTDESGAFKFDSLLYKGEGTDYKLNVICSGLTLNGNPTAETTLSPCHDIPECASVNFVCSAYKTFSGRVLYANSTVPVGDAYFIVEKRDAEDNVISQEILRDGDGKKIMTNANGNFTITVPSSSKLSVRVAKDGHKMEGDGYILNEDKEKAFVPQTDLANLQIHDDTKVRIVGRLCGGNIEAGKQLGFGMSKNNLGDNPVIVLQLEGNNTASIVYKNNKPDDTTIETTVNHPYSGLYAGKELKTEVTYEKKRIVIHPDPLSGEFFVDLFPTKYKVVQMYCEGYSTLYATGEGLDIIDFSDSTANKTMVGSNAANTFAYNGSYIRTYHKPVTVTYNQLKYGSDTHFIGEETLKQTSVITGKEIAHTIASYDAEKDKVNYVFGYPVFVTGNRYQLQVHAHEDFYYNNVETGELDMVPVENGTLYVTNGLLSTAAKDEVKLDKNGQGTFYYEVGNTMFSLKGDDAIRSLNMSVKLNGYYYDAEPLRGFVTGTRSLGVGSMPLFTLNDGIKVLDYLCDPPGSSGYAYRSAGTKYSWTRTGVTSGTADLGFDISIGVSTKNSLGLGFGAVVYTDVVSYTGTVGVNFKIPLFTNNSGKWGSYQMELSERIQTSSDALDIGARADVYIGATHVNQFYKTQSFDVVDEATYQMLKPSVETGAVKVISKGQDSDKVNHYLVIADRLVYNNSVNSTFAYSQKHIVGTLIPELIRQRDALLVDGPYDDKDKNIAHFKQLSEDNKKVYYLRTDAEKGTYEFIADGVSSAKDEVSDYNNTIKAWKEVIRGGEKRKLDIIGNASNLINNYSVAGTSVSYSQSSNAYCNSAEWNPDRGVSFGISAGGGESDSQERKETGDVSIDEQGNILDDGDKKDDSKKANYTSIKVPGSSISFKIAPTFATTYSNSDSYSTVKSTGYGFYMNTNDNGYMTVALYGKEMSASEANNLSAADLEWLQGTPVSQQDKENNAIENAKLHNFVFYTLGGAGRNPWFEPDSTIYYLNDATGKGYPLGERLLKIDNPRIYIDHPVINNMPEDEVAEFKIRLVNETEINPNSTGLNGSQFMLVVDDNSNPNGAVITMDGAPLANGKTLFVKPGQSMEKTIRVERGTGYDFENLKLLFLDKERMLSDVASISIHYLPVASKVQMVAPENKWTMNTLSSYDTEAGDKKYYIPVSLDGFNVNSDGFHHIELQYKKHTDGESQWTNFCGFYNDSTLYAEATGTKEMIPSNGKIQNVKFYGEKDPIEMEYDLRAVTFRKLGTGFVTRTSEVMSGLKDTRCPEIFGMPKPANGILTYSDVISFPFNEPIAYNYLDETANFQVVGMVNGGMDDYTTTLYFPKTEAPAVPDTNDEEAMAKYSEEYMSYMEKALNVPTTKVRRNLSATDFTIDAMVKKVKGDMQHVFTILNSESLDEVDSYLSFGVSDNSLWFMSNSYAYCSVDFTKGKYASAGLNVNDKLSRVSVTYTRDPGEGKSQVAFYIDGVEIDMDGVYLVDEPTKLMDARTVRSNCNASGRVLVGVGFNGDMTDVRLWNNALSGSEIGYKKNRRLNVNEPGLIAHWPMNEGSTDNVIEDEINGAHLYYSRQSWQSTQKQYSLKLDGEAVRLTNTQKFDRPDYADYSLSLWAKVTHLDADSVNIFRSGSPAGANQFCQLAVNNGNLEFNTYSQDVKFNKHIITTADELTDGKWHNIIVVANKSMNTASLYFDGLLTNTLSGDVVGGTSNELVELGDATFHGNVDNLTFWDHAFPNNSISSLYNRAASGYEMGLLYNLTFEKTGINPQGTPTTEFSPLNEVYVLKDNGTYAERDSILSAVDANRSILADEKEYCPLKPVTGVQNIPFTWTATDNELQINLKKADNEINHQNITIVVRGVEDLSGNSMVNPQRMVVYVDKNMVKWNDKKLSVDVPYGQGGEVKAKFSNVSGSELYYKISCYSSWLTISQEEGRISQLDEETVTFTIDEGMAPGVYNTIIYLLDENGLYSNLPLMVNVVAEEPDYAVVTDAAYKYQMNISAQVQLKNDAGKTFLDDDSRDIVYAVGQKGEILGMAYVNGAKDKGYVYLTVRGTATMATTQSAVLFRLWRASTGKVTNLTLSYTDANGKAQKTIKFAKNVNVGSHSAPVIFEENTDAVQILDLKKGWNWVSLYVYSNTNGIKGMIESESVMTPGDIINIYDTQEPSFLKVDENGNYYLSAGKDATERSVDKVYQIWVQNDCKPQVHGIRFTDDNRVVKIKKAGWNDLAYLCETDKEISDAMGDYMIGDKAKDGAVIMSRSQFSMADKGKWYGSLQYMHPGQGYYLYHIGEVDAKDPITIRYYDKKSLADNSNQSKVRKALTDTDEAEVTYGESSNYKSNMPVVAELVEGTDYRAGDVLVAYANGRVAGRAEAQTIDDGRTRFFIMLNAEAGAKITWALERDGEIVADANSNVRYAGMSIAGNIDNPLSIDFVNSKDNGSDVKYYNVNGIRVDEKNAHGKILIGDDGNKVMGHE